MLLCLGRRNLGWIRVLFPLPSLLKPTYEIVFVLLKSSKKWIKILASVVVEAFCSHTLESDVFLSVPFEYRVQVPFLSIKMFRKCFCNVSQSDFYRPVFPLSHFISTLCILNRSSSSLSFSLNLWNFIIPILKYRSLCFVVFSSLPVLFTILMFFVVNHFQQELFSVVFFVLKSWDIQAFSIPWVMLNKLSFAW